MTKGVVVFILLVYSMEYNAAGRVGHFWQISDLHLDRNYSTHGDTKHMCHGNLKNRTLSRFGNYLCDSPWDLIEEAISAMKNFNQSPDFILWTGDIMAHVPTSETNWSSIFEGLENATKHILNTFPGHLLLPVIGNHDVYPSNTIPENGFEEIYKKYLSDAGWDKLIPYDQHDNFLKGGYYIKSVDKRLQIIILNTNIYLSHNKDKVTSKDPGGQLQWLKKQLILAKLNSYKVIITAHSPPGYFERNPIVPFLLSPYADEFIQLLIDHSDVILTQIYGHTHTDTFRLFRNSNGPVKTHAFIAPSVSPMKLLGTNGINPSIRLYSYDENVMLDYEQYFLNLTKVSGQSDRVKLHDEYENKRIKLPWKLLYRATELYGVKDLSLLSLYHIFLDISTDMDLFEKYYLYNSAGVRDEPCSERCYHTHICAIIQLTKNDMERCMQYPRFTTTQVVTTAHPTDNAIRPIRKRISKEMRFIIVGVALGLFVGLIIMTVITSVFCVRRKFSTGFRYQKHGMYS